MRALPDFQLSYGQMAWAVCYGMSPDQRTRDQLRYLRALSIPETAIDRTPGSGNQLHYGFVDLVEVGLALTALGMGMRPADIAAVVVGQRADLRPIYTQSWLELPEAALAADWVKSRGKVGVLLQDEILIRVHDRHGAKAGTFDLMSSEDASEALPMFAPVERVVGQSPRRLLPLKRLMIQWVVWALEAPVIRPGRKG
jgi:hypothetical protein